MTLFQKIFKRFNKTESAAMQAWANAAATMPRNQIDIQWEFTSAGKWLLSVTKHYAHGWHGHILLSESEAEHLSQLIITRKEI